MGFDVLKFGHQSNLFREENENEKVIISDSGTEPHDSPAGRLWRQRRKRRQGQDHRNQAH